VHVRKGAQAFFSEEKKQKTFMSLSRAFPEARRRNKSFLVLFFKKELLLFLGLRKDLLKRRDVKQSCHSRTQCIL
jgi:hypothetical protein